MSEHAITVNLTPWDALEMVKKEMDARLVYQESHDLGNGRWIGTLIYEKYYMRVSSRVALVVIADNIYGYTGVRCVSTGSSQGMIFNFDFGASEEFSGRPLQILAPYTIE